GVATQDIKNPNFRPHVFARGPHGDDAAALFHVPASGALVVRVSDARSTKVQLRDRDGVRWLDLHAEPQAALALHIPQALAAGLEANVERDSAQYASSLEGARGEVNLDGLGQLARRGTQERGASDALKALFQTPFGPRAVEAFLAAEVAQPEPVY